MFRFIAGKHCYKPLSTFIYLFVNNTKQASETSNYYLVTR